MAYLVVLSIVVAGALVSKLAFMQNCKYVTGVVSDLHPRYYKYGLAVAPCITFNVEGKVPTNDVVSYEVADNVTIEGNTIKLRPDDGLSYEVGETVTVMYKSTDVRTARVYSLFSFWLSGWYYFVLPYVLFSAFIFAVLGRGEFAEFDLRKMTIRKISKEPEDGKTDKLKR
jgi:hypothetical protein